MPFSETYNVNHEFRFKKTLEFLNKHISKDEDILDLGVINPFSVRMKQEGYHVINTNCEDLDLDLAVVYESHAKVITAFEIFEHLLCPFNILTATKANKLVSTVPLRLWFSSAYKSKSDPYDRHYHEFEDWQFDWLLEKAGWTIIDREKWISPTKITGLRPLLRNFTPRHYAIYAERK